MRLRADAAEMLLPLCLVIRLNIVRTFLVFSACVIAVSAAANNGADQSQRPATLVNQYRVSHGLPALIVQTTVAAVAREHIAAMAKAGQLNHDDFPSRVRRSGLPMCVENVGWNCRSPEDSSMVGARHQDTTATCSIRGSIVWALAPSPTL